MQKKTARFVVLAALLAPIAVVAEDSVVLNGRTYTCDNTCVVSNNGSSIRDCCGGRVRVRFMPV